MTWPGTVWCIWSGAETCLGQITCMHACRSPMVQLSSPCEPCHVSCRTHARKQKKNTGTAQGHTVVPNMVVTCTITKKRYAVFTYVDGPWIGQCLAALDPRHSAGGRQWKRHKGRHPCTACPSDRDSVSSEHTTETPPMNVTHAQRCPYVSRQTRAKESDP